MMANASGLTIHFAVADSRLGKTLVGTTDKGICCVLFGETEDAVVRELADEFPDAVRVRDDSAARAWAEAVFDIVAGRVPATSSASAVPLDLRGTDFQRRVWAALRDVPSGTTVSYSDVAAAIGSPKAARAVAGACAANHAAVVVPCHRVVRRDGGLGGYRWGLERKRRLLEREAAPGYSSPTSAL